MESTHLKAYVTNGGQRRHILFVVSWYLMIKIIKLKISIGTIEKTPQIFLGQTITQ